MIFSSWQFIFLFLPVTLGVFFALRESWQTARKLWLVAASLFFYGYWKVELLPLILFSIAFNYTTAEALCRYNNADTRRLILIAGVTGNLALLGYFKYTNFLLHLIGMVSGEKLGPFDIILPLAISFFTFTQISYVVDVYRDRAVHYPLLDYSLFVVFFPHLIAGPIVRHWEIIPQFAARKLHPSRNDVGVGIALFLFGLYKKRLLADPQGSIADAVFNGAQNGLTLTWFDAWFGTLAFTLQLYFDFSGYSDMAIGLARLFAIKFPCNFLSPYQADSISEFWRRWHITLTRFLREYVYFPLGGNRCSHWRQAGNIMATMFLSGLWHGAGLHFVAWGGLHGAFLVLERQWQTVKTALGLRLEHEAYRLASVGMTFFVVVCGWVLFRANSFATAGSVFSSMFGLHGFTVPYNVGEARLHLGTLATHLGGSIVNSPLTGFSYAWSIHGMILLLAIVWFAPNSLQLLGKYDPALEKIPSSWFQGIRLNFITGLLFGLGFFWLFRSFFTSQATPFIYFNF